MLRSMLTMMLRLNPGIVEHVVNHSFHLLHLVDDSQLADLAMVIAGPCFDVLFHMMEEWVHLGDRFNQVFAMATMLFVVCGFCLLQKIVRLTISLGETGVVPIVVVQVEAKLVRQELQPGGEFVCV